MSASTSGLITWRLLQLPKRGHQRAESEDAFAWDPQGGRYAIADGAAQSICAGYWARLLVDAFRDQPVFDRAEWQGWLLPVRKKWWDYATHQELPWYAEHKVAAGAAATFVGLVLLPDGDWRSIAVGDACLFQVRGAKLIEAFPLKCSTEFRKPPRLVGARPLPRENELLHAAGQWQPGDQLILATDAMAAWFLAEREASRDPAAFIQYVLSLASESPEQVAAIDELRDAGRLRDDDVTLVLFEF